MTHEELKIRIRNMKWGRIESMNPNNLATLTDDFCKELVTYILVRAETNDRQRKMIRVIKVKYGEWRKDIGDITWGTPFIGKRYPEYMDELDFKIDCGETIEDDSQMIGSWKGFPVGTLDDIDNDNEETLENLKEENAQLKEKIEQLKLQQNTAESEARIKELEAQLKQVTAENEALKKQAEESQKQPKASEMHDEWIVELLAHLCYEDEQVARSILDEIRGKEDPVIADIIFERKKGSQISPKTQNRELWRILHAAKLYRGIEGNLNTALRRRQ